MLSDPPYLAKELCRIASSELGDDDPADVDEVAEVLEEADRGYQPGPTAHLAVVAAALLMRQMSALKAAVKRDACVMLL